MVPARTVPASTAMIRRLTPVVVALFLLGLPAIPQETVVRIAVALPANSVKDVSDSEVRDRLVKALNEHKPDKKLPLSVQAIALEASPGSRAITEATGKNCQYVLYSQVRPLETSYHFERTADGSVTNTPIAAATLEYLLKRVSDGATYAAGTAKSDPQVSSREAILQGVSRASSDLFAALRKGNGSTGASTESGTLEKISPAPSSDAFAGARFCAWLPIDLAHADALRGACDYAMTLPERMPNFVCHQETSRFEGKSKVPTDLVTGTVRYEDGEESYFDLKLNGKVVTEATARSAGLWSSGQFEANLRAIFHDSNGAVFKFSGEKEIGTRTVWIFNYRIARQNEPLWQLRTSDKIVSPPYTGELWVDANTGEVAHFESSAQKLPSSFAIQSAEILTDYENVAFSDGTAFVLPVTSAVATQFRGLEPTRNVAQFSGCHKFRAKARMIVSAESSSENPETASSPDSHGRELDENETIYAILRQQAIHEDAVQLEREQESDLHWAAIGAMSRLAALEKEREKNAAQLLATNHAPPEASSNETVTTFKVTVKLVPVTVVVRDAKGRAVGNLTKTDFLLFDGRNPQMIGSFSLEKARVPSPAEHSNPSASTALVNGELKAAPETNYVAYVFDDIHSTSEDIENARNAAARHLDVMRPEDHAAVFTTSGTVNLSFTADREQLKAALHALQPHSRSTAGDCPQLSYYIADQILNQGDGDAIAKAIADALDCAFGGVRAPAESAKARDLAMAKAYEMLGAGRVESENTLAVLRDVIRTTAAMPGRRSLVLVSPGFLAVDPDTKDRAMALIDWAVEAGLVVNALNVRGVLTTSVSAKALDLANTGQFDRQEATANDALMSDLASGTGGLYFHNNDDLDKGFRQTADVPEYIYVLGFSPQKLDGKFHKLHVKLSNGEKLTVQARAGYYALKRAQ